MAITLKQVELRNTLIRTRMPFRYGIATLNTAPYLLVCAEFDVDGKPSRAIAADILPPKWFTKQPDSSPDDEIDEMVMVIRRACHWARGIGKQPSVFEWWRQLYARQMADSQLADCPPLLKGFGVSLLERAAIDAFCRRAGIPFFTALCLNRFGIRLGDIHAELSQAQPRDLLPAAPSRRVSVRHTVGLADPLANNEIVAADLLNDGLPQALDECIKQYGLTHFKIKLPAEIGAARDRMKAIAAILSQHCQTYAFTLDGNEFFSSPAGFRDYWQELRSDPAVSEFLRQGLLLVEQPLDRDVAVSSEVGEVLASWHDRPPLIIDESDSGLDSFPLALEVGYDGTSHKNCKGVFKGIANACLARSRNLRHPDRPLLITGEDLVNLPPVALLQDLAVGAALGLTHIERNGHHYVDGLRPFSRSVHRAVLQCHGDLYCLDETSPPASWPRLDVTDGQIVLESVSRAPFGYAMELEPSEFDLLGD
jgi:hypothetical protein